MKMTTRRVVVILGMALAILTLLAACDAPEMIPLYAEPTAATGADIEATTAGGESRSPARVEPPDEAEGQTSVTETPQPEPTDESAGRLTQLTEPGCCMEPFWAADGEAVLYIDRPPGVIETSVYGVDAAGGDPQVVDDVIGKLSLDGRYRVRLVESTMTIDDLETGETWVVEAAEGREVHISPDAERLAWADTQEVGAFSQRLTTVSVAALNGSGAREVITVVGGNLVGWLDAERLLLTGRPRGEDAERTLFALNVDDGERAVLADTSRAQGMAVAPGGEWVFYAVAFDPEDESQAGMWVVSPDGETRHEVPIAGSAQWRDDHRLVIVPMEMGAESHRLVEFDVETGELADLTDPDETPFRVLADDWRISPEGDRIAFVSADDEAIWVLDFGQPGA